MGSAKSLILLVAPAVLFLALVVPSPIHRCHFGKSGILRVQLADIEGALYTFRLDVGRFPTTAEGLEALVENPGLSGWAGPYFRKASLPHDPWGNHFEYSAGRQENSYDVWSYGADGVPGGQDLNGDCHVEDCDCREPQPPLSKRLLLNAVDWLVFVPLLHLIELLSWVNL